MKKLCKECYWWSYGEQRCQCPTKCQFESREEMDILYCEKCDKIFWKIKGELFNHKHKLVRY